MHIKTSFFTSIFLGLLAFATSCSTTTEPDTTTTTAQTIDTVSLTVESPYNTAFTFSTVKLSDTVWLKVHAPHYLGDTVLIMEGRVENRVKVGTWQEQGYSAEFSSTKQYVLLPDSFVADSVFITDFETKERTLDQVMVAGVSVLDGTQQYFTNGTITAETTYAMGVPVGWQNNYDALGRLSSRFFRDGEKNMIGYAYNDSLQLRFEGPQTMSAIAYADTTLVTDFKTGEVVPVIQEYKPWVSDSIWSVYSTTTTPNPLLYQLRYDAGVLVDTVR